MIATVISALASLAAGFLLGGCASRNDELSQSLLTRNAQLENEIAAHQHVTTALAAALVLTACGLAGSLVRNLRASKGGPRAAKRSQTPDRQ